MPTIQVVAEIEADFEVFCGICGAGVCGDTIVKKHLQNNHITVACSDCKKHIDELENKVYDLECQIFQFKQDIIALEKEREQAKS